MRFTHVTQLNEELIQDNWWHGGKPIILFWHRLQEYLANNENTAGTLKGRPLDFIEESVQRWILRGYPSPIWFWFWSNFKLSIWNFHFDGSSQNNAPYGALCSLILEQWAYFSRWVTALKYKCISICFPVATVSCSVNYLSQTILLGVCLIFITKIIHNLIITLLLVCFHIGMLIVLFIYRKSKRQGRQFNHNHDGRWC